MRRACHGAQELGCPTSTNNLRVSDHCSVPTLRCRPLPISIAPAPSLQLVSGTTSSAPSELCRRLNFAIILLDLTILSTINPTYGDRSNPTSPSDRCHPSFTPHITYTAPSAPRHDALKLSSRPTRVSAIGIGATQICTFARLQDGRDGRRPDPAADRVLENITVPESQSVSATHPSPSPVVDRVELIHRVTAPGAIMIVATIAAMTDVMTDAMNTAAVHGWITNHDGQMSGPLGRVPA